MQLEPSFRPRFSKYPKPKRVIGPGSLKTGAKEGYRPWSSRTRSQKVAGSQGYRPRSKETWCQKGVNGFGSSNNRSHRVYLRFEIREPLFLPMQAPLQFHSLSPRARALPSLSLSSSFTVCISRRCADRFFPLCFTARIACSTTCKPREGKSLHRSAFRCGVHRDLYVATSLVDMYGKFGLIADARRVFDGMSKRSVVSWTAMLVG